MLRKDLAPLDAYLADAMSLETDAFLGRYPWPMLVIPEPDPEAAWEREFQQQLFRLAAAQIRDSFAPTTWQAFWGTAVEGKSGLTVATELGMSVGAVYVARSRVLARLKEEVDALRRQEEE